MGYLKKNKQSGFLKYFMQKGKRSILEKAFKHEKKMFKQTISKKLNFEQISEKAFLLLKPHAGVKPMTVFGKIHRVPFPFKARFRNFLAAKWFVQAVRERLKNSSKLRFFEEFSNTLKGNSLSLSKNYEGYTIAKNNRTSAYLRFKLRGKY